VQVQELLLKLKSKGTPLGEYVDEKIFRGILTGLNKAFIIDEETKDRLVESDPKSAEIIKPFLSGRDIKRYNNPVAKKFLIFTRRGIKIDDYPAILKHLEKYRKNLQPKPKDFSGAKWPGRKPGSYKWYEIQDAVDYHLEFEKTKIMLPDISKKAEAIIDYSGCYCVNTAYIIPVEDLFLLGIINSKAVNFFYSNLTSTIRGGYLRFIRQYMEQIPIPNVTEQTREEIENHVTKILSLKKQDPNSDTSALEAEIDGLVYDLYGLTEEEVGVVEGVG